MSKIDQLIKKHCPNGVKFVRLSEVSTNIFAGGTPKTSHSEYYGGNIPWLRSGEINFNEINDTKIKITELGLNESNAKWIKEKSVLVAMTGATVARVGVNLIRITANQSVCAIETNEKVNYKYVYYFLANNYKKIKSKAQGALEGINLSFVRNIVIPLPPLEIQQEIVRILDKFSTLEEELEEELKKRRVQYEYYRDKLLDFKEGGAKIKVKDMFKRLKGTPITAEKMKNIANIKGDIRIFAGGKTMINALKGDIPNANITNVPAVLVQSRGIIDVIYYEKPFTFKNEMWAYTSNSKTSVKYLFYVFKSDIQKFRSAALGMGALPQISIPVTDNFEFFLPSIDKQKKIVSILEKFDNYCNDLSEGLPAEIAIRHKQYEYYRDKLLTFKELKNA